MVFTVSTGNLTKIRNATGTFWELNNSREEKLFDWKIPGSQVLKKIRATRLTKHECKKTPPSSPPPRGSFFHVACPWRSRCSTSPHRHRPKWRSPRRRPRRLGRNVGAAETAQDGLRLQDHPGQDLSKKDGAMVPNQTEGRLPSHLPAAAGTQHAFEKESGRATRGERLVFHGRQHLGGTDRILASGLGHGLRTSTDRRPKRAPMMRRPAGGAQKIPKRDRVLGGTLKGCDEPTAKEAWSVLSLQKGTSPPDLWPHK